MDSAALDQRRQRPVDGWWSKSRVNIAQPAEDLVRRHRRTLLLEDRENLFLHVPTALIHISLTDRSASVYCTDT